MVEWGLKSQASGSRPSSIQVSTCLPPGGHSYSCFRQVPRYVATDSICCLPDCSLDSSEEKQPKVRQESGGRIGRGGKKEGYSASPGKS